MKLKMPPGTTGFWNERNEWVCTGSQMGRRNTLPQDLPGDDWKDGNKLHLVRVPFEDHCYDQGGAYWGSPANLYIATEGAVTHSPVNRRMELIPCGVTVYVRANNRDEAKAKVKAHVPTATFYR